MAKQIRKIRRPRKKRNIKNLQTLLASLVAETTGETVSVEDLLLSLIHI